jgi:hypothetical protein
MLLPAPSVGATPELLLLAAPSVGLPGEVEALFSLADAPCPPSVVGVGVLVPVIVKNEFEEGLIVSIV